MAMRLSAKANDERPSNAATPAGMLAYISAATLAEITVLMMTSMLHP